MFFDPDRQAEAMDFCVGCPVRLQCLHHAIRNREPLGVWGGVSERQRTRSLARSWHRDKKLPLLCATCGAAYIPTNNELTCGGPHDED